MVVLLNFSQSFKTHLKGICHPEVYFYFATTTILKSYEILTSFKFLIRHYLKHCYYSLSLSLFLSYLSLSQSSPLPQGIPDPCFLFAKGNTLVSGLRWVLHFKITKILSSGSF